MSCGRIDLACRKCRLSKHRIRVVPGKGSCRSPIVFVGEAPGKEEDLRGEPFVGRAGKILDDALREAGIAREDAYISNLVKCRPPNNRKPRKDEIEACSQFLSSELKAIKPRVVCALGQTAAEALTGKKGSMTEHLGRAVGSERFGRLIRVVVAYHPAACLYQSRKVTQFKSQIADALALANTGRDPE
jgi:DNA polymerase